MQILNELIYVQPMIFFKVASINYFSFSNCSQLIADTNSYGSKSCVYFIWTKKLCAVIKHWGQPPLMEVRSAAASLHTRCYMHAFITTHTHYWLVVLFFAAPSLSAARQRGKFQDAGWGCEAREFRQRHRRCWAGVDQWAGRRKRFWRWCVISAVRSTISPEILGVSQFATSRSHFSAQPRLRKMAKSAAGRRVKFIIERAEAKARSGEVCAPNSFWPAAFSSAECGAASRQLISITILQAHSCLV
jgi:hypothetical protein